MNYIILLELYKRIYDRKIDMGLFVMEGLICGNFMCRETILVHWRKFVSLKLQNVFAFLSL